MTDLIVWDGDLNKLPEPEIPFLYKDKEYYWEMCPCGCDKPLGFLDNEVEHRDFGITVRLRGNDQAEPMATVLVKLGKMEEMIQTGGDGIAIVGLFRTTIAEMGFLSPEDFPKVKELMASKGIATHEMFEAVAVSLGIPPELALALYI